MKFHRMTDFGMGAARIVLLLACLIGAADARDLSVQDAGVTTDARAKMDTRIEALLAEMTIEEKVGQLTLVSNGPLMDWPAVANGTAGALINFNNAADIAKAQKLAANTRLGIPLLFGLDVVHGFRTQYPVPLGEAAAFSPELSQRLAKAMAEEARHVGVNWTYAPMADLSRDPRWGRIVEGFGEDPLLGAELTGARVKGIQQGGLIATVKHFAGYGAPVGGRDYAATLIPQNEFHNFYLPPYHAGVEAGAGSVMSAFNALNGKPSTASRELLTDILRTQWGFSGFVTSDWGAVQELMAHGIAATEMDAAVKAMEAGVDMDMMSGVYRRNLPEAVRSGRVKQEVVDEAVRRVLRTKFRFGLFDAPPVDPANKDSVFPNAAQRALAREAARKSFVLLKNDHALLPISAKTKNIAVVGPLADARCEQLGPHAARGQCEDAISYRAGIEARAAKAHAHVHYAAGCDLFCRDDTKISEALAAAHKSEIIIAVLGEPRDASGEAASKAYLDLSGEQGTLLNALIKTGKPVVLVLMAGRPLDIHKQVDRLGAVLMTWYPGTEGGNAVADVLFGDAAPTGKLPLSWPRSVGQVPIYYNDLPSGRPHAADNRFTYGYYDQSHLPLYPFGFGLSYTTFAYSDLTVTDQGEFGHVLSVKVTNTGKREGEEIVQLYMREPIGSQSRPVRKLGDFTRLRLKPGETREVTFSRNLVCQGQYEFWIGSDSNAPLEGSGELAVHADMGQHRKYCDGSSPFINGQWIR